MHQVFPGYMFVPDVKYLGVFFSCLLRTCTVLGKKEIAENLESFLLKFSKKS